jgi:hypothetical protein
MYVRKTQLKNQRPSSLIRLRMVSSFDFLTVLRSLYLPIPRIWPKAVQMFPLTDVAAARQQSLIKQQGKQVLYDYSKEDTANRIT